MKVILCFLIPLSLALSSEAGAKELRKVYYPNGALHFEYEIEGMVFNGSFTSYYADGRQQAKGQFRNNQKTGTWKFWDARGMLRSERSYTDNSTFAVINQWLPDGTLMTSRDITANNNPLVLASSGTPKGYETIYANRLIVKLDVRSHTELLDKQGLAELLMELAAEGKIMAFTDQRFVFPVKDRSALEQVLREKPTGIILKEEHYWSTNKQTMLYKVTGIGLITEQGNTRKEICWFYAPDVEKSVADPMLSKLLNHEYGQLVESSTIRNDNLPDSKNEEAALKLLEKEVLILIYFLTPRSKQLHENSFQELKWQYKPVIESLLTEGC